MYRLYSSVSKPVGFETDLVALNLSAQSMCNLKGTTTEASNGSCEILLKVS